SGVIHRVAIRCFDDRRMPDLMGIPCATSAHLEDGFRVGSPRAVGAGGSRPPDHGVIVVQFEEGNLLLPAVEEHGPRTVFADDAARRVHRPDVACIGYREDSAIVAHRFPYYTIRGSGVVNLLYQTRAIVCKSVEQAI